jgi:multidrug efflux pump subunit AcrA (membrane-fusion protein)
MRFFNRAILGLSLMAITLGLFAVAGYTVIQALNTRMADDGRPGGPPRERVFSAEIGPMQFATHTPVLTTFGQVETRHALDLRAPIDGRITDLADNFENGGIVRAGQILFEIDPSEAQSARDTAAADLEAAQNDMAEAEGAITLALQDIEAAENQATLQARAFDRQQDLFDRGVGSIAALENAELALAAARQALLARRQSLAQAQAAFARAQNTQTRQAIALADAERILAQTIVIADFTGVLTNVDLAQGGLVSRGQVLARLIGPDDLEVAFRISTAQYARLVDTNGALPELPVEISLQSNDMNPTLQAILTRDSGAVEQGQSGRLLFAQLDMAGGLRVGDFVQVNLQEPPLEHTARIPATAYGSDGTVLVLGDDNRLTPEPVTLMRRQGDDVLVRGDAALDGAEIVLIRTPALGGGILVDPIRRNGDGQNTAPAEIALDDDRRARLIAAVQSNTRLPDDVKARLLEQLNADLVSVEIIERIETRMGG